METVKEKLAKLLLAFEDCPADRCLACEYQYEHNCGASRFADYLIQNGVTIQEWVSVDERLPEENGLYFVYACDEGCPYGEGIWYENVVVIAEYSQGEWFWYEGSQEYDLTTIVTHWNPCNFPQPPKEVQ